MPTKVKSRKPRSSASAAKAGKTVTRKSKKVAAKRSRKKASRKLRLEQIFSDYTEKEFAKKAEQIRNRFTDELRELYVRQGLVLYVGAGVSKSIGLPTWPELIRSLTVNMMAGKFDSVVAALDKQSQEKSWEPIFELQDILTRRADQQKPILMMARAIKDAFGNALPYNVAWSLYVYDEAWRQHILDSVYPEMRPQAPSGSRKQLPSSDLVDAVVALARAEREVTGVRAIVNYNFDDLLEEKLREQNVRCRTVRSGADSLPPGTLACYHVHGVLPMQSLIEWAKGPPNFEEDDQTDTIGNFVFSEDEYHTEYSDPYRWSNMTQMRLLGQYIGLFVGLSLEDPNIRRLIDVTHKQYPEQINYAILPRKEALSKGGNSKEVILRNLFEEVETSSFEKIGVRVIWVDGFQEIPAILQNIANVN
jgi:hypothetical protein